MTIVGWFRVLRDKPSSAPSASAARGFLNLLTCGTLAGLVMIFSSLNCAYGYSLEGQAWPTASVIALQFNLGTPSNPLQDRSATWNDAAMPVLTMWNQKMQRVQCTGVINPSTPVTSGDGVNSVVFATTIFGQSFGQGTLAVTYYWSTGPNMVEADVLFNKAQNFDSYRGPLQFGSNGYAIGDIRRVLLHELGHGLGLGHPDSSGQHVEAVMNSIVSDQETLSSDDISGIQSLYGTPLPAPIVTPPPAGKPGTRPDFNGDGKPDILWQNRLTGQTAVFWMNGTTVSGGSYLQTFPLLSQIRAGGDFNGDGKADLLCQNTATGQPTIRLMSGVTSSSAVSLPTRGTQFQIAGAADFNGDGKLDILWQNTVTGERSVWYMNGTTYSNTQTLWTIPIQWRMVVMGDFSGDGKLDIIWQNSSTGQRLISLMNGTSCSGIVPLVTNTSQGEIAGAADFNDDGKSDILWQNTSTGERAIWLMNGTSLSSAAPLPAVPPEWQIRNH